MLVNRGPHLTRLRVSSRRPSRNFSDSSGLAGARGMIIVTTFELSDNAMSSKFVRQHVMTIQKYRATIRSRMIPPYRDTQSKHRIYIAVRSYGGSDVYSCLPYKMRTSLLFTREVLLNALPDGNINHCDHGLVRGQACILQLCGWLMYELWL